MDDLYETIQKAEAGNVKELWRVAWRIVWKERYRLIERDWLEWAVAYFEKAALHGLGDTMLDIGAMYSTGRGVPQDRDKALYWYNQAAAILHPKAFRCLGYALNVPFGYLDPNEEKYEPDYRTAFGYFFKGAMLNEPNSIYKIGDMFLTGKYVDVDQVFALNLYHRSYDYIESDEDDSYASVCLRIGEYLYRWPEETGRILDEARIMLKKAIEGFEIRIARGDDPHFTREGYNRAKYLLARIESGKKADKSDGADHDRGSDAYELFISSETMQYPEPKYPIAELDQLKIENPVVKIFDEKPFNDLLVAAEAGDKEAMYYIAFYCFNRFEAKPNEPNMIDFALYYYHKAIRHGRKSAMYNLASAYYYGEKGIPVDRNKAYLLYLHSGEPLAQGELGVYYARGEIVERDYEKAFKHFAKCALSETEFRYGSLTNLTRMYREGIFVQKDEKFAAYLEDLSAKLKKQADITLEGIGDNTKS